MSDKFKQKIKLYYHALRNTRIYGIFNTLCNLFFRHNNLLFTKLFKAGFGRNRIVIGRNVVLRHCRFEIHGSGNTVIIGDNCRFSGLRIFISVGKNKVEIGKSTFVFADKKQRTMFNACEGGEITIGDNCLFSNSIELHTTDYHKILEDGRYTNPPKNIHIGSHCWIGLQCLILKGTSIADNVIVGARSLLNKEFPESNAVIAGNPAGIVKRDVTWDF